MRYQFPEIRTIDDVLPHLEGRKEFVVANRGDHTIINYAVAFADTFPEVVSLREAVLRECRGITFRNSDGAIIRRPYHKFFNVGERDETRPDVIDELMDETAVSLEKMDGSMISPFCVSRFDVTESNLRWGTKMGVTDVAEFVTPFLKKNPNYVDFARVAVEGGFTPIFEFCSRKNRIVVDYPEDRLTLTAVRNMVTGIYVGYEGLVDLAEAWGIEVVQPLTFDKSARDVEGVVIRLREGHMAKMKAESYLRIHKAKDKINVEKNTVDAILAGEMDDILPELGQEDRDKVKNLEVALHQFLVFRSAQLQNQVREDVERYGDRKTYALECQRPHFMKAATFKLWDEPTNAYDYLLDQLKKSLGKEVNYADFKRMWEFTYEYR